MIRVPHYFAIFTPGHSGSLWLTKLLNSHSEVLCWHEGVLQRIYPRRYWQATYKDRIYWLQSISSIYANHYHKIFRAIGDIGSLDPASVKLPEVRSKFALYGLIRNGVLFVRSQARAFDEFKILPEIFLKEIQIYNKEARKYFPQIIKIKDPSVDLRNFIFFCWRWFKYLKTIETEALDFYRIEDLNKISSVKALFKEVTGVTQAPEIFKQMIKQRINPHIRKKSNYDPQVVYHGWSKTQQLIFKIICGSKMKKYYQWSL